MLQFIKSWALPISMVVGVLLYFISAKVLVPDAYKPMVLGLVDTIQPLLIFMMLFVSFCKVDPKSLVIRSWHVIALAFQALTFVALGFMALKYVQNEYLPVIEGAMLCFICPTATAAVVIVSKLGAKPESLVSYTMLSNLLVASVVPVFGALLHPDVNSDFLSAFLLILNKVLPLLLFPLLLAWLIRKAFKQLLQTINQRKDLAFYLWIVALALAIAQTTRSIMHSEVAISLQLLVASVSLISCIVQFALGRALGTIYHEPIAVAQSLGQKNTVLAMWLGFTFFMPITAIAGGFYSIWHNLFNSWQLYKHCKHKV